MKNPGKKIAAWLYITAGAVFTMALIGAITRLTESGLSITEWKPITGALPPVSEADWQKELELYLQSPQGEKVNPSISMRDFKVIYFWEWFHRLWGRLIGLVYALPLLFFWRYIPRPTRPDFIAVLFLGFLQGGMGWYMVKSGLVDEPAVSHYRLAAHLMLAFLIYAALLRLAFSFSLRPEADAARLAPLRGFLKGTLMLGILVMTWGAFVAGLDAGMVYNTFPKMNQHWWPPEMLQHVPVWKSFIEEPATVQFTHRVLAIVFLCKIMLLVRKGFSFHPPRRIAAVLKLLAFMTVLQVGLGIATLMTQVNIHLATAHQGGALVLLGLLVCLLHDIPRHKKEKA